MTELQVKMLNTMRNNGFAYFGKTPECNIMLVYGYNSYEHTKSGIIKIIASVAPTKQEMIADDDATT